MAASFRTDVHELSDRELVARFTYAVRALAAAADQLDAAVDRLEHDLKPTPPDPTLSLVRGDDDG
jgi:hypothetical protein